MKPGKPSRTAIATAAARAAHLQTHGGAHIHVDQFAARLIGIEDPQQLRDALLKWNTPDADRTSAYFALRHRFAEDRLQLALDRGVRQIILLGAGLDSLALRRPELARGITFVEVDHPDSQRWKLARLQELGLDTPSVVYVPVDFSTESLPARLAEAGVSLDQPTFFSWLGVTQYIDLAANTATLSLVAGRPRGSEIVFDFIVRGDLLDPPERAFSDAAGANSAARREPWVTYFDPLDLQSRLREIGFSSAIHLTPRLAASLYYVGQPAHVTPLHAWQVIAALV